MAMRCHSGHKDIVNKLFTILTLVLLPYPALVAGAGLPATVGIVSPTADVHAYDGQPGLHYPRGLALQGQSGQMIRYTVGQYSGLIVLDADGLAHIDLPKSIAATDDYMLHYD